MGNGGVCVWENVSQDIVPISTNTQSHLSLLMDCLTYPHCSPQNRIWTIATPINKTVLSHGCTLKCETSEASEMHLELLTSDVVNLIQSWLSKYHAIIQSVNKNDMHGAGWFWSWWHNMISMMIATIMVFDGWQARHPLVRYYGPTCLLADHRLLLSYHCDTDNGDGGGDDVDGDHHHHHNPSNWLPLMRIIVGK